MVEENREGRRQNRYSVIATSFLCAEASIKNSIEDWTNLLDGSQPLAVSSIRSAHHVKKRFL